MLGRLPSASCRIIYAKMPKLTPWHLSVAKNMAHRLGTGDILMSLDCDNFIGEAVSILRKSILRGCGFVHMWSGIFGDGTCGRVGIRKEIFYDIGGYDESFYPMGFQDLDLVQRALASGHAGYQCPSPQGTAIKNSKEEGMRHCSPAGQIWKDYDRMNREKSYESITSGRFTVNGGRPSAATDAKLFRGAIAD
jgi:hypothetical protein